MTEKDSFKKKITTLDKRRALLSNERDKIIPWLVLFPLIISTISFTHYGLTPVAFFVLFFSILGSKLIYQSMIGSKFKKTKREVKKSIIEEFMSTYYENIIYKYYPEKHGVHDILNESDLISADKYEEEDVIIGEAKETKFYLSEIKLSDKDSNDNMSKKFKGFLFKIKIKGKSFPKSSISSSTKFMDRLFGTNKREDGVNFSFNTKDQTAFDEKIRPLFPFIQHLISKQEMMRIAFDGEEITFIMKSDIKFLDEPVMSLNKSFDSKTYFDKCSKQIHSLFYIIEAFSTNLNELNLEEHLELKALDYIKLSENK